MKEILKKVGLILIISIATEAIFLFLQSDYMISFLVNKIVEIQITLIAINTATSSIIVSKLHELSKICNKDFKIVYDEIKLSLFLQIALISFSIFCLIIRSSNLVAPLFHELYQLKYVFGVFLLFSFICSIDILKDTGNAMFDILIESDKNKPK